MKTKTPAPTREGESFRESLQPDSLYKAQPVQLPSVPASSPGAGESPPGEASPGQTHQDLPGWSSSVKQGEQAQTGQLNTKNCPLFFPIGLLK